MLPARAEHPIVGPGGVDAPARLMELTQQRLELLLRVPAPVRHRGRLPAPVGARWQPEPMLTDRQRAILDHEALTWRCQPSSSGAERVNTAEAAVAAARCTSGNRWP